MIANRQRPGWKAVFTLGVQQAKLVMHHALFHYGGTTATTQLSRKTGAVIPLYIERFSAELKVCGEAL